MLAIKLQDTEATSQTKLDAALTRIASFGVFGEVWMYVGSGGMVYPSDLCERINAKFDAVAYAATRCASLGLGFVPIWCPGGAPMYSTAFRTKHPTWDVAAHPSIAGQFHWLNFHLPDVQAFCASVIVEMATRYPTIAIHLDYIRWWAGPPYDAIARPAEFVPADITATVRLCVQKLREKNLGVRLGAHVMTSLNGGEGQQWPSWLADPLYPLDYVTPMAYLNTSESVSKLTAWAANWATVKAQDKIKPCLSVVSLDSGTLKASTHLIQEATLCRDAGYKVTAFFDNRISAEQAAALAVWNAPVTSPPTPTNAWQDWARACQTVANQMD